MASSMITLLHSPCAMLAAGFKYIHEGDTVRCDRCNLEVSDWTYNMDPFTTHSERSPNCEFVRSIQSSGNQFQNLSYSRSLSTIGSSSRRPLNEEQSSSKRQRTESTSSFKEMDGAKHARPRTFSHCRHPTSFTSQMIEAGFFYCNVNDRVICIYCDLICQQWNIQIDNPCEVHKILSPNCVFVKSELTHQGHNLSSASMSIPTLPSRTDYIDPEKRRASFLTWSNIECSSVDEFVQAGFFYTGTTLICFYCNGSFESWDSNNYPIAEHVRLFPSCNYARQLCGEELYQKIQQPVKHIQGNGELATDDHQVKALDGEILLHMVNDRLDLPISRRLLLTEKFQLPIIKRCWEDQLRLKNDDFVSECDLFIACIILQKQINIIDVQKKTIIIPHVSMKEIYKKKRIFFNHEQSSPSHSLNNSQQSYTDIMVSFSSEHQSYTTTRQALGAQFKETKSITIARERSLIDRLCINLPRRNIFIGGWMLSDTGDYLECPHCHMRYWQWKSADDFLLIHRYLSPLCLFVLSTDPLFLNEIPIKYVNEQFPDDYISTVETRPYAGLAQSKESSMFSVVSERQISFNRYPGGCPDNAFQLAAAGFHYTNILNFIRCFYCRRSMAFRDLNAQTDLYLQRQHLFGRCFYTQQTNDVDLESSIQQASNKCGWCMKNDKKLLALPCRHFCLCEKCGPIKHTCSKCEQDVHTYVIVYSS